MEYAREPNLALRRHMAEAGWNGPALAAALVKVAAESNVRVRYDRTTVAHWLAGTQPRPPGPRLLEEAFTRRLGRPVSSVELGLGTGAPGEGADEDQDDSDPLQGLLWLHRRPVTPGSGRTDRPVLYQVRTVPGPRQPRPGHGGPLPTAPATGPGRIGSRHAQAIRELTAFGARYYDAHGGAPARSVLAAGLRDHALLWLKDTGSQRARTELLTATAQLVRVLGRTYADDRLQGEAQRHHRLAYRLAVEADDPIGQAMALRDQSTLAGALRHSRYAAELSDAALAHLPAAAPPGVRAFVLAQHAAAAARDGRFVPALRSLEEARQLEGRTGAEDDPMHYPEPALLYQAAQVHRALRDPDSALGALRASLRLRPDGEHRTVGLSLLELAHLELDTGDVHRARQSHAAYLGLPLGPVSGLARARLAQLEDRLAALGGRSAADEGGRSTPR
ncbi:tol-pal system YbgF family protein [Kitasatospora phosalacinea]|uniref:tetratricopeptide repeat protein n=1 Tax=Kitasatospora phosalacinea TaxID=2065 RepID=UPI00365C60E6